MGGTPEANWVHLDDTGDEFLHLISAAQGAKYQYSRFKTSNDTYDQDAKEESISNPSPTPSNADLHISGDVRSDGDVIVLYTGSEEISSTTYPRAWYARRESDSWTADVHVSPDGETKDYIGGPVKRGESDKMHFFYKNDTDSHVLHKSLTSGNSLSSEEQVSDTAVNGADHSIIPACYYDTGGVERITIGWVKDSDQKVWTSEIDDDGTPSAEENASDLTVEPASGGFAACLAVVGTTAHLLYSDDADRDIQHDQNVNGGGWGTDVEDKAGSFVGVSCNVYERSGTNRLAMVTDSTGADEYDEIDLVVAGTAIKDMIGMGVVPFAR